MFYRSGSDPALASSCDSGAAESNIGSYGATNYRFFKSQDENRKPSISSNGSAKSRTLAGKSPGASPKTSM